MTEQIDHPPTPAPAMPVPGVLGRIRRNHGLEHATIHVLSMKTETRKPMAGYSDPGGFYLIGDLPSPQVSVAAHDALERMRKGQANLAVHPNCGTSYLTSAGLAAMAAIVALWGVKSASQRLMRFPNLVLAIAFALMAAQPLGIMLQRDFTTSGVMGGMEITGVRRMTFGPLTVHRIDTKG